TYAPPHFSITSAAPPCPSVSSFLFFPCHAPHPDLHSFPTRRSSDLKIKSEAAVFGFHSRFVFSAGTKIGFRFRTTPIVGCEIPRSEEHTSELQSRENLVCRLLLEKKNNETGSNQQCTLEPD